MNADTSQKPPSRRRKGRNAEEQFLTASLRIRSFSADGPPFLVLSDLLKLKQLPPEIAGLSTVDVIRLERTRIADIKPLAGLSKLTALFLDDTQVEDLEPLLSLRETLTHLSLARVPARDFGVLEKLSNLMTLSLEGTAITNLDFLLSLKQLQGLALDGTQPSSFEALGRIEGLERLSLGRTPIEDIGVLSELKSLKRLQLDRTRVRDISPVSELPLEFLSIRDAAVGDLRPLASMLTLQEAAYAPPRYGRPNGVYLSNSAAAKIPPFNKIARLRQPFLTIEAVNEARRQMGLKENYPGEDPARAEDASAAEILGQKPASHIFAFREGRIEGEPQHFSARHPAIAEDIRGEIYQKAAETLSRLRNCNAPRRLIGTVDRVQASVGTSMDALQPGVLQMRFRSLEADVSAYDTEEGRRELPEDALAMLRDLTSSIEDLMGCFPELADIEAERLAQRLNEDDLPRVTESISQILVVAKQSEIVAPSAIDALIAGEPELRHDTAIIDSEASHEVRVAALKARGRTLGYMLLVYRNFVAGAVKIGGEIADLGADTWKSFKQKAPGPISEVAVALLVAGLVNGVLGPVAALGAFAASFRPLRERAKKVADRLTERTKKAAGKDHDQSVDAV